MTVQNEIFLEDIRSHCILLEYIALVLPSSKESKKSGIGRVHLTLVRKFMFVCLKIER